MRRLRRLVIAGLFWTVVLSIWNMQSCALRADDHEKIDHPAVCATPKAHTEEFNLKTALKDEEVKDIYKKVSDMGGLVKAEMAVVFTPNKENPEGAPVQESALWLWVKDRGISKRLIYIQTKAGLKVVVILIPSTEIDNGLIELLKKGI